MPREQFCDWCGESLGFVNKHGPESCGKVECNREIASMIRAERENAILDAIDDIDGQYGW